MLMQDNGSKASGQCGMPSKNTTGACEGFHSVLKLLQFSQRSRLGGRRLDWLLKVLTGEVSLKSDQSINCHSAFANSHG